MFKFGALATLRGRLPTTNDVKKKEEGKKGKKCKKRKIKQQRLIL